MSRATELAAILSRKGYVHREKDCLEAAALLLELERDLAESRLALDAMRKFLNKPRTIYAGRVLEDQPTTFLKPVDVPEDLPIG